jgi:DHA1 family tetracycline resistance protein-like MFS transporter
MHGQRLQNIFRLTRSGSIAQHSSARAALHALRRSMPAMNRPLIVIFAAIVLDAIGIGLIFPILPSLLQDVTHVENVAPYIGIMTALYAVMQFICAPVLGSLSDRLGRRPVLLISIAGAAINYLFLAFAPSLWMLLLGRAIAGLTGANMSVALYHRHFARR